MNSLEINEITRNDEYTLGILAEITVLIWGVKQCHT